MPRRRRSATACRYVNPEVWPDNLKGMSPSRFDHCLLYGDDLDGTVKLFSEVLGFALAEQVMAGPEKTADRRLPDLLEQGARHRLHPPAGEGQVPPRLVRARQLGRGAEGGGHHHAQRVAIDIGPTRHGITRGETIYFFDPSGNRNEVFSGGYIYYPDKPPLTWTDDELGPRDLLSRPQAQRELPERVHVRHRATDVVHDLRSLRPGCRFSAAATMGLAQSGVSDRSAGPTIFPDTVCNMRHGVGTCPLAGFACTLLS